MNLHPSLHLDAAQVRQRERAAQCIATMRATLDTLERFIANASAEALRGDYWAATLQDADVAAQRALRAATCDGQARMGWGDGHGP